MTETEDKGLIFMLEGQLTIKTNLIMFYTVPTKGVTRAKLHITYNIFRWPGGGH